jgi:23S rRNA (cytidine1920-2'-O)/16S rRNA (cytidine1409-2'-O)-methyltransferase
VTRSRLDAELVTRGLVRSRAQARELIDDGVVLVDGRAATKASQSVGADSRISLTREPDQWVGRAAHKLLAAIETWPIVISGRRCLDVGASTGGFTQVLLANGATHVTALDVGHGQLVAELSADERVTDLQGINIRDVTAEDLGGTFELVVCDLSFISLALALPHLAHVASDDADLVVLVKPQFEVGRERLSRTGVVTSPHEHRRVLREVHAHVTDAGLKVLGAARSPITGADGNVEFLLWLTPRPAANGLSADDMLVAIETMTKTHTTADTTTDTELHTEGGPT